MEQESSARTGAIGFARTGWIAGFTGLVVGLASCGGGGSGGGGFFPISQLQQQQPPPPPPLADYKVGGTVTGLVGKLILQNNAGNDLAIGEDGSFAFASPVQEGGDYVVTIRAQPLWQFCAVSNGSGKVASEVNHVRVTCSAALAKVVTFAGSGQPGAGNGTGIAASFDLPFGLAIDAEKNLYVGDLRSNLIRKVTSAGDVSTVAGSGQGGSDNGTGAAASFRGPYGLAADVHGSIHVADFDNNLIRKVTAAGVVTTTAGSGANGSADGTGVAATFSRPAGAAVDGSGNIYIADFQNHLIRKITPTGVVTTLAGSGAEGATDGTGALASFKNPLAVAVDVQGNVYVGDYKNHLVRKVTPTGVVTTLAGSGVVGADDGTGSAASFRYVGGLAVDVSGNVFVADSENHLIRKITPTGVVTTLAGSRGEPGADDGVGTAASFANPFGIAVDAAGNVYVADTNNNLIRKITPIPAN
ncbi:NHL repeat-containing protein [Variovorax sp. M-6]|uniref:NHL repeat-containing protein n=1 Tax=Variovorax sp. M-6 TaxID=3233041 RepID=UPI003F97154F